MEYTPTTDQVRAVFIAAPGHHTHAGSRHEAFERWLASITTRTSTDDEREALALLIDPNALELHAYPFPLNAADRVLAAGFRRSAVPEPSAEDEFAPGECTGAADCDAPVHIHGCYRPHRADQCDAPDEYGHLSAEPQGEPSHAQAGHREEVNE